MASFSENYEVKGEGKMSDFALGTDFVGGLIVGGLAGGALSNGGWGFGGRNYGPMPYPTHGVYTQAEMDNMVAIKDSQYNNLNATQESEFNTINRIDTLGINLATGLASLGYENARLSNANQIQTITSTGAVQNAVAEASAKADLCCCETKGMISNIVPELKNFYLTDEVSKLREVIGQQQVACGFDKVNSNLHDIGAGIKAILTKIYDTTPIS